MEMTREVLERYCSNKAEIRETQERLGVLAADENMVGNDVILDYQTGYPRPQAVVGFDFRKYGQSKSRMQNHIARLQAENDNIEEFIFGIPDSTTRRIFQLCYLDGKTQQQVARRVHMHQSTVSRALEKFWEN